MPYSYNCREYPGMEQCPGSFVAETENELWKHIELHAREAHGEDPSQYSEDEVRAVKDLIRHTGPTSA
jgi:predicted small metal-binding protein